MKKNNLALAKQALESNKPSQNQQQPIQPPTTPINTFISNINNNREKLRKIAISYRKAQNLSQRALAAKTGISQTTVSRFEKYGWTSIGTLFRIAEGLNKEITLI